MKWISILSFLISISGYSQNYQYYSYPCNPDSSKCRGELVLKHQYKNGDLVEIERIVEGTKESILYSNHLPVSSEIEAKFLDREFHYRYLLENEVAILKFSSDSSFGALPNFIEFVNADLGKCIEEKYFYLDSTQFNTTVRIQHLPNGIEIKTFLNHKNEAVRIEEHHFDELGLSEIVVRKVGDKLASAWIRRVQ